jgi:hypothetical protein
VRHRDQFGWGGQRRHRRSPGCGAPGGCGCAARVNRAAAALCQWPCTGRSKPGGSTGPGGAAKALCLIGHTSFIGCARSAQLGSFVVTAGWSMMPGPFRGAGDCDAHGLALVHAFGRQCVVDAGGLAPGGPVQGVRIDGRKSALTRACCHVVAQAAASRRGSGDRCSRRVGMANRGLR